MGAGLAIDAEEGAGADEAFGHGVAGLAGVCPFRFYLKHALRMGRVEPEKAELDARDFGTLLHGALQQMGGEAWRECTAAARLREFLLERFALAVRRRYGAELTLPLLVQI